MKNHYTVNGDTTTIYMQRKDGSIEHCLINTDDLDLVAQFNTTWYLHDNSGNTYARTVTCKDGEISRIQMHKLIVGDLEEGQIIDHKDGNGLNNKRENLRITTREFNPQNRKHARCDSRTGVRGVTFDKSTQKYKAHIAINGKQKTLGRFNTIEEAEQVVIEARKEYMPFSQE